jgi:alpha-tubulin suppressor-like RCC1 family protein
VQVDVAAGGLCARYLDGSLDCTQGPMTGNIGITSAEVSIGTSHVCAVSDGHMDCWGSNASGELGDGDTTASATPQSVIAVTDAVQASAGLASTCEVETGGDLWCWGDNSRNQLAQTIISIGSSTSPVEVFVPGGTSAVAVGDRFACALATTGHVYCWGDETEGQTGQVGDSTASLVEVPGLSGIAQITAAGSHACARATGGEVWCWGDNAAHETAATSAATIATPTLVVDQDNTALMFSAVAAGAQHTCGLLAPDNAVVCWGDNSDGQIGDGTTATAAYPTSSTLGCK